MQLDRLSIPTHPPLSQDVQEYKHHLVMHQYISKYPKSHVKVDTTEDCKNHKETTQVIVSRHCTAKVEENICSKVPSLFFFGGRPSINLVASQKGSIVVFHLIDMLATKEPWNLIKAERVGEDAVCQKNTKKQATSNDH